MKNFLLGFLILSSFVTFFSCGDDEDEPQLFIDRLEGAYTGSYRQTNCALTPTDIFSIDNNVVADIVKTGEMDIQVTLSAGQLGALLSFDGQVNSDTSFIIPEFEQDGATYSGAGFLKDSLRIRLTDGCMLLGQNVATVFYDGQ